MLLFLIAAPFAPVRAADRLFIRYDWRNGLDAGTLTGVAQDPDGFIWISTTSGLVRFDGRRFTRVTEGSAFIPHDGSRDGPVYAFANGSYNVIHEGAVEPIHRSAPSPEPAEGRAQDSSTSSEPGSEPLLCPFALTTQNGTLWCFSEHETLCLGPDGSRTTRSDIGLTGSMHLVAGGKGSDILAWSDGSLFSVSPTGPPRAIARSVRPQAAIASEARGVVLLTPGGEIRLADTRGDRVIATGLGRGYALHERSDSIWASFDSGLYRIGPDDSVEQIGTRADVPGGSLMVDRENNLRMASSGGLFLFPEPDTVHVRLETTAFVRSVVFAGGEPWFGAWWGSFRVEHGPGRWRAVNGVAGWSLPTADPQGRVWMQSGDRFEMRSAAGGAASYPAPGATFSGRGSTSASGGFWLPTDNGLYFVPPGGDRPERVLGRFPGPPGPPSVDAWSVLEAGSGELWLATGERVCRADARAVIRRESVTWRCETIADAMHIRPFAELPGLGLLAGSFHRGVLRWDGNAWTQLPPVGALRTDLTVYSLAPGEDGTLWLALEQDAVRIRARPGSVEGYEIVERLVARQGLPHGRIIDVCGDGAGGLWVAMGDSVAHVPASARGRSIPPWPAVLVASSVDGKPLAPGAGISLPYSRNRLELRFAALTFTEPSAVRYRMRLHKREAWGNPVTEPEFRFVDLPAGRYDIAVQASADGTHWQEGEARLVFRVLRPWYLQVWFLVLCAAAVALLAWSWHRMRLAASIRLERQRARIAMDLHDEIGAGLGGIGLMAGLVAREDTSPDRRAELSGRIAEIARTLGGSLQDIVWSLRPGATRMESLAAHIVDRGQALFADGRPEFISTISEDLPAVALSLPVRREVLLIAQEAMHARRHAGASRVSVGLEPRGRRWRLSVRDDGTGLVVNGEPSGVESPGRGGLGLASMRARARLIGADIAWRALPSGGTEVVLDFLPTADSHDRATRSGGDDAARSGT